MLYILNSIWMLCTPNAGQIILFQHFFVLKAEKRKKKHDICCKIQQKTVFHQCSGANTFSVFKITQTYHLQRVWYLPLKFHLCLFLLNRHWHFAFLDAKINFCLIILNLKNVQYTNKWIHSSKNVCIQIKRGEKPWCVLSKKFKWQKKLHLKCLVMFTFVLLNWPWQKLPWLTNKNTFCCCWQP